MFRYSSYEYKNGHVAFFGISINDKVVLIHCLRNNEGLLSPVDSSAVVHMNQPCKGKAETSRNCGVRK